MGLCMMDDRTVCYWTTLDILQGVTTKKTPSVEHTLDRLIIEFDQITPNLSEIDVVLVEKQPHTNSRMRVIEAALLTYFKCRNVGTTVKAYSPRYKLSGQTDTATYAARKKLAVKLVGDLLDGDTLQVSPQLRQDFATSTKKDDRSDVLLMCLKYMDVEIPVFASGK